MHQFYFNDCLPAESISLNDSVTLLINSIKEYDILIKKNIGIEKGIILEKETERIIIQNHSLKDIILSIPDQEREIRRLAFAYFTKYPIQYHLQSDDIEEQILNEEYCLKEMNATNIALAKHHNCFLFSIAIHNDIRKDTLNIQGKTKEFEIENLYGEERNTRYIESQIHIIRNSSLNCFERLKTELNSPIYTSVFEKVFLAEKKEVQQSITEMFIRAKERGLSTPYFPDTHIIKDVTPSHNTTKVKVYELRIYTPKALRVYFYEYKNKVFIAKIGYKSDYKEDESASQAKEIKRALKDIEYMTKISSSPS